MHYESFFAGVATTLLVLACIWLVKTVRTDPVPQIPEKPRRKYRPRKPKHTEGMSEIQALDQSQELLRGESLIRLAISDSKSCDEDPLDSGDAAERNGIKLEYVK